MNTRTIRSSALALAAASAAVLGTAVAYAAVQPHTVSTTDTVIRSATSHSLSVNGGTYVTVLSTRLPAGKWVLSASGDLVDFGPSDYTRCRIVVQGRQVAAVSTMVGDATAAGANGPASYLSPFALTGGVGLTSSANAFLQCWHDSTESTSGYVDPGASLYVHNSGSLAVVSQ